MGLVVVLEVLAGMEQMREKAVLVGFGAEEIEEMKGATGAKDAANFAKRFFFFGGGEMMVHQRGENAIEGRLRVGEFVGEATIESDGDTRARGFLCGARERFGIGI